MSHTLVSQAVYVLLVNHRTNWGLSPYTVFYCDNVAENGSDDGSVVSEYWPVSQN